MKEYQTDNIKNFSIIGAAQSGKTSLGDAILFNSGSVNRLGKTDDGTSALDFESDEIQRKITISSTLFYVEKGANKLNFIDTPGYPAFVSQEIAATNICETSLVVLGAAAGVEVLTKKAWAYSDQEGQSKFIFVNGMDRDHANFDDDLNQAKTILSKKIYPITIPLNAGQNFNGIVDIIEQKAYTETNGKLKEIPIPENLLAQVAKLRTSLMEAAAENSEELLEKYLDKGDLNTKDFLEGIKFGIISNDIIPMLVGSSTGNIGITTLINYLDKLAPNPKEKEKFIECLHNDGQLELKKLNPSGPTLLQTFKITDDPKIGELFFFKVFQGKVETSQELMDFNIKQKQRMGHIFVIQGKNRDEINHLYAGDIGAVAKLKNVSIGDTIHDGKDDVQIKQFKFVEPVISQAIKTSSEKEREKLGEGLQSINKIDPCFKSEHREEFDEIIVSGMSQLHIEIMLNKIKQKYNIAYQLAPPKVPYRETIRGSAQAQGKYKKQTGGHGQYGDCWLEIMGTPIGTGYTFVNKIVGGAIPSKYIPAVDKGIKEAMNKGVLAGFPMMDIQVKLYDGTFHNVDSSDLAFQMAGVLAFKKAAEAANPVLLEPIMNVKVIVPDDYVGDVSSDFNQRRGKIISMDAVDTGYKAIQAHVPMAELYQYANDLKSMTKGEGTYSKQFEKYETVPGHISKKIIEAHQKESK